MRYKLKLVIEEFPAWRMFFRYERYILPFTGVADLPLDYDHRCGIDFIRTTVSKGGSYWCMSCNTQVPNELREIVRNYIAFMNATARLK